ncbi:hypothetical protein AaE_009115 [Aphanomyces astaci]|uniref:Uncharacterized protein n=1 Tax=Aphanomyces astaci TaxID=112090 RepID=A0A6A5A8Q9_APHAT|nr:hypothetical protein AaE_009115 [Aphanomyces astaci]
MSSFSRLLRRLVTLERAKYPRLNRINHHAVQLGEVENAVAVTGHCRDREFAADLAHHFQYILRERLGQETWFRPPVRERERPLANAPPSRTDCQSCAGSWQTCKPKGFVVTEPLLVAEVVHGVDDIPKLVRPCMGDQPLCRFDRLVSVAGSYVVRQQQFGRTGAWHKKASTDIDGGQAFKLVATAVHIDGVAEASAATIIDTTVLKKSKIIG